MGKGKRNKLKRKQDAKLVEQTSGHDESSVSDDSLSKRVSRLYNRIVPGKYTSEQDDRHVKSAIAIFVAFIVLVAMLFAVLIYGMVDKSSTRMVVPVSSYVNGQQDNVREYLENEGFSKVNVLDDGSIECFGNKKMVDAYKTSFEEKNVIPVQPIMFYDFSYLGIESISLSEDGSKMTFVTKKGKKHLIETLYKMLDDKNISKLISVYGQWHPLKTDGEKMTFALAKRGKGAEPSEYYTTQLTDINSMYTNEEKKSLDGKRDGSSEKSK